MADYEYTTELDVRFRDLDAMGHVNNAVYATYLEQARADYYADVVDVSLSAVDTVLVNLSIAYQRPVTAEETVTVAFGVGNLGESSIPMEYEVRTENGVAATAETMQIVFDRETGESRSIPQEWRDRITRYAQSDG
jgi:acyl-CoA thioester hydrolase